MASDKTCECRLDIYGDELVRCRFCKARLKAFDELLEIIEENDFYRSTEAREVVDNYRKEISDGKTQGG